jgi:hypothetical protein
MSGYSVIVNRVEAVVANHLFEPSTLRVDTDGTLILRTKAGDEVTLNVTAGEYIPIVCVKMVAGSTATCHRLWRDLDD